MVACLLMPSRPARTLNLHCLSKRNVWFCCLFVFLCVYIDLDRQYAVKLDFGDIVLLGIEKQTKHSKPKKGILLLFSTPNK